MAWTATQLDALETAIARGTKTVAYQDRTVTYHSLQEMLELRGLMIAALASASGESRISRIATARD